MNTLLLFLNIYNFQLHLTVGCKFWRSNQDQEALDAIGATDHSDVCLTFLFTSHKFGGTLGKLNAFQVNLGITSFFSGIAFKDTLCEPFQNIRLERNGILVTKKMSTNVGFITFQENSLLATTQTTFAHEVGHSLGLDHDGVTNNCNPKAR